MRKSICGAYFLLIVSSAFIHAQDKYPTACGDLLAELHSKPEHLEFIKCNPQPNDQTKPLVAEYRVKGIYAASVERYLHKTFGMDQLVKDCCLWGGREHDFEWEDKKVYYLVMSSGETFVGKRAEWGKIPYFYVTLSREMKQP